jgi:hypothetical protein
MQRNLYAGAGFLAVLAALGTGSAVLDKRAAVEAAAVQAPLFEVDPMWPKPLPNHWLLGMTIGVSVVGQDHIWIPLFHGSVGPVLDWLAVHIHSNLPKERLVLMIEDSFQGHLASMLIRCLKAFEGSPGRTGAQKAGTRRKLLRGKVSGRPSRTAHLWYNTTSNSPDVAGENLSYGSTGGRCNRRIAGLSTDKTFETSISVTVTRRLISSSPCSASQ